MSLATSYDGDYSTAFQVGPDIKTLDEETQSYKYKRTMQQKASSWSSLARGTAGPGSSYLHEETEPSNIGGEIYQWDRLYYSVPPSRNDYESFAATYQVVVVDGSSVITDLAEISLTVKSRIAFTYTYTTDPDSITLLKAYKICKVGSIYLATGTSPGMDTEIIAEDSVVKRWKSNIYERRTRYIPQITTEDIT